MRSYSSAFIKILEILVSAHHYTIGDFLIEFFGSPPGYDQRATGRSLRHGKMLGMFMEGKTVVGVGEVLQEFHRAAEEFLLRDQCAQWTLAYPYQSLKPGYAALTSYAAQKVCHRLLEEQKAATNPDAGLHVFRPRKQGEEEIKLRLSWDTYGMNTLADIKAVLQEHQPLTFCYMFYLVHPEHHDEKKSQFRYGPPEVVRKISMLQFSHPTCPIRLQQRSCVRSTMHTIATQNGCRFSTGSYTTAVEHRTPSLATQAEWVSPRATQTSFGPLRN